MASLSKPVIAAAAMLLVEQGRLALRRPLRRYLPDFTKANGATHVVPFSHSWTGPVGQRAESIRVEMKSGVEASLRDGLADTVLTQTFD